MADITQGVLFILACAFLFGLTLFLFRDQITSRR
jgi:Na+-driven multidrug efflux pump